jgi:hypothetical protein
MATEVSTNTNEIAILARIIAPDQATLSPEAARALMDLDFTAADRERMQALSAKAAAGTLSADEREAIESYNHVGHILALLQSKARLSLQKSAS